MDESSGSHVRQAFQGIAIKPAGASHSPSADAVRVKLMRVNCNQSLAGPPDDRQEGWAERLKIALGSASMDFVDATLYQLQAAARLRDGGISELAVNAALAMIESERPRSETECALVVQMACLHSATLVVLGRLGGGHGSDRNIMAAATAASRLSRSFAVLVETLRRLRCGGAQTIRIERVNVEEGGRAVIGSMLR